MLSSIAAIDLNKAFFLGERRVRKFSAFSFFRGLKKLKGWKKLSGFSGMPSNFSNRVAFEKLNIYEFIILLGELNPTPKEDAEILWLVNALNFEYSNRKIDHYRKRFPILNEYAERGLINPFIFQLIEALEQVKSSIDVTDYELNICLEHQLSIIESLVRRAVVLDLNICAIKDELKGKGDSEKFQNYAKSFEKIERRLDFFKMYPVLFRIVTTKLILWSNCTTEFLNRLKSDRCLLEQQFSIPGDALLKSIIPSGDTHNNGRAVIVVEFINQKRVVYKPRSVSLEKGFQTYLKFFNSVNPDLCLRRINVSDKIDYGWVEYVSFCDQSTEKESDNYHYKLGFLTAIIFSINGVDVFFENLISAGPDPVIIDLETMFHTSIDAKENKGPIDSLQLLLFDSVMGIGILPQPNVGASESELFDVSVMGAKKNAQAPYKVTGIENFGRSDMRITEIPGWIHENRSSSENSFSSKRKAEFLIAGLTAGLGSVMQHKGLLVCTGGEIDKCFISSKRRLIVRDTKVYGALQQDETHPDLIKNQIDREWHWDNLWYDLLDRPNLLAFIESELNQLKRGDIPYFSGEIGSMVVQGGDGKSINLTKIITETPIQKVKNKLFKLTSDIVEDQVRLAATSLGLDTVAGITQPVISPHDEPIANAASVANFILKRFKFMNQRLWCDTSFNPAPKAKHADPVRVIPCDPFLYDGLLGVAMFLHDLGYCSDDKKFTSTAKDLVNSILNELEDNDSFIPSGYAGISSVVYVLNRCIEQGNSPFAIFDSKIPNLIQIIDRKSRDEKRFDFLLGLSGIACALIPYVRRTSNLAGHALLESLLSRLIVASTSILKTNEPIEGMDYVRGLSHGITGVALSIYRLGEFFQRNDLIDLSASLVSFEYSLIKGGKWTDSHTFKNEPLVGWCHGSAGISLALSVMPKIFSRIQGINEYYDFAFNNTLVKGVYSSKCLCHGTSGNLLCLGAFQSQEVALKNQMAIFEKNLFEEGFSSIGAAQTMGIGLMTGLTGAGYYLLGKSKAKVNFDFLTLS